MLHTCVYTHRILNYNVISYHIYIYIYIYIYQYIYIYIVLGAVASQGLGPAERGVGRIMMIVITLTHRIQLILITNKSYK